MVEKSEKSLHQIHYDGCEIAFQLHYRRRKSLAITVNPDTSVEVAVPLRTRLATVQQEVQQQADWILKQQRYFADRPPPGCRDGVLLRYLGQPYRLQIETVDPASGAGASVRLSSTGLLVAVADTEDAHAVREQLQLWYRRQAERILPEQLRRCVDRVAEHGLPEPTRLTLRHMKTRWGSCSQSGRVTLNTALVQADLACIDYVILHELCHLRVLNHSPAFYQLLDQVLPDWRCHEQRLNEATIV